MNATLHLLVILVGWGQATSAPQISISPDSRLQPAGFLNAEAAHQRASLLVNTLSGSATTSPAVLRYDTDDLTGPRWEVVFRNMTVWINGKSGALLYYSDDDWMNAKQAPRMTYDPIFSTDQSVIDRLAAVRSVLDIPQSAKLERVVRGPLPANGWGTASLTFRAVERNRLVLGHYAVIEFDSKDGRLVSIQRRFDYELVTLEPTLTASQAKSRAVAHYQAWFAETDRWTVSTQAPTLRYVAPNGKFGAAKDPRTEPKQRMRIAYVFEFGEDRLWVDGVTGENLGGFAGKRPPRP